MPTWVGNIRRFCLKTPKCKKFLPYLTQHHLLQSRLKAEHATVGKRGPITSCGV